MAPGNRSGSARGKIADSRCEAWRYLDCTCISESRLRLTHVSLTAVAASLLHNYTSVRLDSRRISRLELRRPRVSADPSADGATLHVDPGRGANRAGGARLGARGRLRRLYASTAPTGGGATARAGGGGGARCSLARLPKPSVRSAGGTAGPGGESERASERR